MKRTSLPVQMVNVLIQSTCATTGNILVEMVVLIAHIFLTAVSLFYSFTAKK